MKLLALLLLTFTLGLQAGNIPNDSIHLLGSNWTTDKGKKISLTDLQGDSYFVGLIFTSCKGVCPLLINDLKLMSYKLTKEQQKNVKFLLISIDPEYDTPKVLTEYKVKMKLDDRWTFLNGKDADVTEIAAALEFQFKESKTEKFTHSSSVYLMNEKGQIVAKQAQRMKNLDNFISKAKATFSK